MYKNARVNLVRYWWRAEMCLCALMMEGRFELGRAILSPIKVTILG